MLDRGDPFHVLELQMTAALENFQRVFFVGEPEQLRLAKSKRDNSLRGVVPGGAMRGLPVEVISELLT